jgi:hypothetical protein
MIYSHHVGQDPRVARAETIAVLGLEVVGTVDAESVRVARELTTALRARAARGPHAIAPNSSQELVDVKLLHDCPDERLECMTKIGRALHADYLLYGKIQRGSRGYQVAIRLLRVADGQLAEWTDLVPVAEASGARLADRGRGGYEHLLTSPAADRVSPRATDRVLIDATNQVFWEITKHKPGQRLDMSDPRDRAMSKTWMDIHRQVRGHRDRATQLALRALNETGTPYVLVVEQRDGSLVHQEFPSQSHLDVMYTWRLDQPDYTYLVMFDLTRDRGAPIHDTFALSRRQQAAASGW